MAYRWHSPSLNFTEHILNSFYDSNVLWIDVGSNLGLRSLYALSEGKNVFFIEPNSELNALNKERCKLNGFINYCFYEVGASETQGNVEFIIDATSYNSSLEIGAINQNDIDRKEIIKINTLDNLFSQEIKDLKIACIKIDVEGHEIHVLNGARNFIERISPTMIIEVNEKGEHFEFFFELMTNLNYYVFEIGSFRHNKFYRKITPLFLKQGGCSIYSDFLVFKDDALLSIIIKYSIN